MSTLEMSIDPLKKYRHAAWGFAGLNLVYLVIFYLFLPPFNIGIGNAILYTSLTLALLGTLSYFMYRGSKILTLIVLIIYCARVLVSIYALTTGEAFTAVPFVLPTMVVTCYMLGRAVWDWP